MKNLIKSWQKSYNFPKDLLKAFQEVPREKFILKEHLNQAYVDAPLPILANQTISQPTTVMIMTNALELKKGHKVLEIGTGSGYQAAIISKLVSSKGKVYTTEIIPELVEFAEKNIAKLKIKNIKVINTDGSQGLEEFAPFDAIIVTAASPSIPKPLIEQLKINGILVLPVGSTYSQEMLKIRKISKDKIKIENLGEFIFVPLKGKYGQ